MWHKKENKNDFKATILLFIYHIFSQYKLFSHLKAKGMSNVAYFDAW